MLNISLYLASLTRDKVDIVSHDTFISRLRGQLIYITRSTARQMSDGSDVT